MMRPLVPLLAAVAALLSALPAEAAPTVLAAISLQDAMTEAAADWTRRGHAAPKLAFAGTPALARQVQAGAAVDLFVSADEAWADALDRAGLFRRGSRATFLSNRLVVAVPRRSRATLPTLRALPRLLEGGRLALAEGSVPAGRYAQAALERARLWPAVARRTVRAENVRAALALVARGTAAAGLVYATDVSAEPRVRVAGVVPPALTPPIRYVLAIPAASRDPEAAAFRAFLLSPAGRRPFLRAGFLPPR